jgi:hypothetical protein
VTAVHVLGRGFFTPSFPNLAAFRAGVPDAEAQRPAVDFVQSRNKRGCSILTLAAAEVAHQACLDAGLSPAQPALVFGSCHGEMEIAVAQMEMFQEDKGLLSPARFKNSVHNTGAGMFSIAMDNRGYATAIAGGHDTVALSLLEAILLLQHDRYETAVVAPRRRAPACAAHALLAARGAGGGGGAGARAAPRAWLARHLEHSAALARGALRRGHALLRQPHRAPAGRHRRPRQRPRRASSPQPAGRRALVV